MFAIYLMQNVFFSQFLFRYLLIFLWFVLKYPCLQVEGTLPNNLQRAVTAYDQVWFTKIFSIHETFYDS